MKERIGSLSCIFLDGNLTVFSKHSSAQQPPNWKIPNYYLQRNRSQGYFVRTSPSPFTAERAGQGCLGHVLDEARHAQGVRARHGDGFDQDGEAYWAPDVRQGEFLRRNPVPERHPPPAKARSPRRLFLRRPCLF